MRKLLLTLLVPAALLHAQSNTSQPLPTYLAPKTIFTAPFNALAASLTQVQAAPGAGTSLYITDIVIGTTTTTSGTFALQSGTGANCVTGTAAIFPASGTANRFNAPPTTAPMLAVHFITPIKLAAASALCVIGVATNTVSGQINGYIAP